MRSVPMRQADALSKEAQFSGLPKIAWAYPSADVNTAAAVYVGMNIDTMFRNYGGYTMGGGAVIVPEPGVYAVRVYTQWVGGAAYIGHAVAQNGAVTGFADGIAETRTNTAGVTNPTMSTNGFMECKAGDTLAIFIIGPGVNTVKGSGQSFLQICKIGGAY